MILLKLGPRARNALALLHDMTAAAIAWWLAFLLRFNLDVPDDYVRWFFFTLPGVVGLYGIVFWGMRLYRGLWRYASLPDLRRILMAVSIGALAVPALFTLAGLAWPAPRSTYLISPLLLILAMGGSRLVYRALKEHGFASVMRAPGSNPVIVLGAEGPGMRQNVRDHCDAIARLPISAAVESLNVSNAAAIALYAASVA